MPVFDPLDFLKLGQALATNPDDEARLRTAIGRAYYTCHLTARDQLYGIDKSTLTAAERKRVAGSKASGDHIVVIRAIAQNRRLLSGKAKRLSDQLAQLKEMRQQADYCRDPAHRGTTSLFSRHSVSSWYALAHAALTLASNLLPDLQRLVP